MDSLEVEVRRVADRLRSLSPERLTRAFPPYVSRAAAALTVAQLLADTACDLEGVERHLVPDLGPLAVGDQVAVTGHDLVAALTARPDALAGTDVQRCLTALRDLRLSL
jgi:hypothetical protein